MAMVNGVPRWALPSWLLTLALWLAAACNSSAPVGDYLYACTTDSDCRDGRKCIAGVCGGALAQGDSAASADGAVDGLGDAIPAETTANGAADSDAVGDGLNSADDGAQPTDAAEIADGADSDSLADAGADAPDTAGGTDAAETAASDAATDAIGTLDGSSDSADTDAGDSADVPIAQVCPGDPGCACKTQSECSTGVCLEAVGGSVCAKACADGACAAGEVCVPAAAAGGSTSVCASKFLKLCTPCLANATCAGFGQAGASCVDGGGGGSFCGAACSNSTDCPSGFQCSPVKGVAGATSKQCVPTAGQCTCTPWAIATAASTACALTNAAGSCLGTRSCSALGLSECTAKTPAAESCDGKDNNCDGATDEGFELPAKTGAVPLGGACKGPGKCGIGKVECSKSATAALCSTSPGGSAYAGTSELCNGLDDDCNGLTDEVFSYKGLFVGDNCTGQGACGAGVVECASDATAACSTNPGASADESKLEICNNKDDDCDGQTDEVCVDADKDGYCAGTVVVTAGAKICQASGDCQDGDGLISPSASELCNGKDDNCDGSTDNPSGKSGSLTQSCYDGAAGTSGVGVCKTGTQTCSGGAWASCTGQIGPASEVCASKLDEDCDGATDEGCPASVPSGSYGMGCPQSAVCSSDSSPGFPYPVQAFTIAATEVSVAEYQACVAAKVCSAPTSGSGCNWGVAGKEGHPVNCVTWDQATAFCGWQTPGGSLPSEFEWQAATQATPCAPLGTPPTPPCPSNQSKSYPFDANTASCSLANYDDGKGCGGATLPATGTLYPPFNLAHMAGNVAEWTSTWFANYPLQPGQVPGPSSQRTVMGGSYSSSAAEIYRWSRQGIAPTAALPTVGFRCRGF